MKSGTPVRTVHIIRFHALEVRDQLNLRAAVGYLELAMFEEANAELEEIDPSVGICLTF